MSITATLTVLWYSALPWLWLIALLILAFAIPQIIARRKGYTFCSKGGIGSKYAPYLFAVLAIFLVPLHTQSTFSYVNTWVDWLALISACIGIGIFTWLVFHPICYLRNNSKS